MKTEANSATAEGAIAKIFKNLIASGSMKET